MRAALRAVLACLLCVACGGNPFPAELRVGVYADIPGIGERDAAGRWSGFEITLVEQVLHRLGTRASFRAVTAEERDARLLGGELDLVVATYSITDERIARGIAFTVPYLLSYQDILIRGTDAEVIRTVADLRGRRVCTGPPNATPYQHLASVNRGQDLGIEIVTRASSSPLCVDLLMAGTVDAVVSDAAILSASVLRHPGLRLAGTRIWPRPEQYAFGLAGPAAARTERLDAAIREMVADGSWRRALIDSFCPGGGEPPCHTAQVFLKYPPTA
ncbi:transporter substrate-binding domain-containing protein [Acrocarpospora catenulata]|uniref:transporter substrate-binding domain-containing protein n=1 Tax=Acrocarpospora catenulata TaxID=2836182 RepID=UPI001BDAF2D5|nr:transporter substrate-binding domain-containing protein [Acrocarpospora catenulata]